MVFEHAEPDSKIGRGRGSILSRAFVFVAHIMFQLLCEACLLASVSCEHFSANFSGAFAIGAPLGHLLPYLQTLGLSHKPHFPARHTDILYPQEGRGHPRANSPTSNFLPTLPVQMGWLWLQSTLSSLRDYGWHSFTCHTTCFQVEEEKACQPMSDS